MLLCILPRQDILPNQYTMHTQILATVDTAQYGVDISGNLSFNTHINSITSKANKTLGFLKQNIRTTHLADHELAYQTLLRPQVECESVYKAEYPQG